METTRQFDAQSLSQLIELRLKETHKPEQAAAFVRLGVFRLLLDALSKFAKPSSDLPFAEIDRVLRARRKHDYLIRKLNVTKPEREDPTVFLTHIDSDHQALVFDFDSLVDRIGELSIVLESPGATEQLTTKEEINLFRFLREQCSRDPVRVRHSRSLKGSLSKLEPVGELSDQYQKPDFSDNRLRPMHFFRK